jgi:alpha-tubulin suppressor-like RCC1 family protein
MRREPIEVVGVEADGIATGQRFTCARDGGRVLCWGDNVAGQLGVGWWMPPVPEEPIEVPRLDDADAISLGHIHACARRSAGAVSCWGGNQYGQSWPPERSDGIAPPVGVSDLPGDVVEVQAGYEHTCARTGRGDVLCWGAGRPPAVDAGEPTLLPWPPVPVAGLDDVTALSSGLYHDCAVRRDGGVWCWGDNSARQLGDGTNEPRREPVRVVGLPPVVAVSAGGGHSCALTAAAEVYCWGNNAAGQLGDGTTLERDAPVRFRHVP